MSLVNLTINGKAVEYKNELNGTTRTITFEIASLQDDIRVNFEINPFGNFIVNAAARVDAKIASGSTEEDKDDTVTSPTQKPEQQPEQKPEQDENDKEEDKEEDKNDNVDSGNNSNNGNNSNGSTSDKDENNDAPSNGTLKNKFDEFLKQDFIDSIRDRIEI